MEVLIRAIFAGHGIAKAEANGRTVRKFDSVNSAL
jgi:hypothetical protein